MTYCFDYINPEMRDETLLEASVVRQKSVKLSCRTIDCAYVLPSKDLWIGGKCLGGVVTPEDEFVRSSAWHEGVCCDSYKFNHGDAIQDESVAIYMGFFTSTWGHAITDNLKKLWFLETERCENLTSKNAKFIYLTHDNAPLPDYAKRLFLLAGCDISQWHHVTQLTRFSQIVVPDNSFVMDDTEIPGHGERYFTEEYVDVVNRIKNAVRSLGISEHSGKLYFSRTGKKIWYEIGEKSIEREFRKLGYEIIHPEEYSVEEQIGMLMRCSSFAATEGSISHNSLFCEPTAKVTILRKVNDVNKYQMAVNAVTGADVTYIDVHRSIRAHKGGEWGGPFYLYVNTNLERFLNKKIQQIPLYLRPSWWQYNSLDKRWYTYLSNKIDRLNKIFD